MGFLSRVASCHHNESIADSISFCKDDIFDQGEKCMFDSKNDLVSIHAQRAQTAQLLANLFFTGCDNSETKDPFYKAVVECSYYAVLLGKKSSNGKKVKVFLHNEAIQGFDDMKTENPLLFTAE